MKVYAIPRFKARQLLMDNLFFDKANLISINDALELIDDLRIAPPDNQCLSLVFDDIDPAYYHGAGMNLFDKEQAKQIVEFVRTMPKNRDLVVHCTAGVSRSGAVAEFCATQMLGIEYEDFRNLNSHTVPNGHVYRLLCTELYGTYIGH